MGRWSYSVRWTVEECKSISTIFLNAHHYFEGGVRWGGLSWSRNGKETGSIGFVISTVEGDEYIRFRYTHTDKITNEKTEIDYKARLTWTPCYFGGRRCWFICPLFVNGCECGRRVGSLYLGGGKYFGCRHCHDLTYQSCREHRSSMEWFAKRLKVHERYKQMCAGERRKGFSKRQLLQMEKLKNKIVRLPEFPPRALIVHKSIKGR